MGELVREGSLGSVLFRSHIITEEDIRLALNEQQRSGARFGEALVRLGIVTQEDIDWALSNQLDIPYVRIRKEMVDPAAVHLVPAAIARKYTLISLIRAGEELSVAMADPLDAEAVAAVEEASGCRVSISMGLIREIREMQDRLYGPPEADEQVGFSSGSFSPKVLEAINADVTCAKLLDYLLLSLLQNRLNSLSFRPLKETVTVSGTRGKASRPLGTLPLARYPDLLHRLRRLSSVEEEGPSSSGTLFFAYKGKKVKKVPFRILFLSLGEWEYVTIRPAVPAVFPDSLDALELSEADGEALAALTTPGDGVVLVAAEDELERARFTALCVDACCSGNGSAILLGKKFAPCAGTHPVAPLSGSGREARDLLMAALEHDASVIGVQEVTDPHLLTSFLVAGASRKRLVGGVALPTVEQVLGQLCYLRDQNRFIPSVVRGIVAFRGLPVLCPLCREESPLTAQEGALLPPEAATGPWFRSRGCAACGWSGYLGTRWLAETVLFEGEFLRRFEAGGSCGELMESLRSAGFRGIAAEAAEMLKKGELSPDDYISIIMF